MKIWLRRRASFDEERKADAELRRRISSEERVRFLEEMCGSGWTAMAESTKDFEELLDCLTTRAHAGMSSSW